MRIEVPERFLHAGTLSAKTAGKDPRRARFREDVIEVDMRDCEFIRPPAELWTAIYLQLAATRGVKTRLLVPANMGVCVHLKSLGLFDVLKSAGVEVDDRDVRARANPQLILPLSTFRTEDDVDELANNALEVLGDSGYGAANLYPIVTNVFSELAMNAIQHSESEIDPIGLIQFYDSQQGTRFVCTVADGGIGIRRSLERIPEYRELIHYDWDAIDLALRERVSGTGEATRGIGLFGIAEEMRLSGRILLVHSGQGIVQLSEDTEPRRMNMFPGTLAYASIPA